MTNILVVDDDPDIRTLVETVLRLADNVEVRQAATGVEALQQADWPDVVVLDLMMPGLDGLQVAGGLRAARGDQVRLVVFSAIADQFAQRRPELAEVVDVVVDKSRLSVARFRDAVLGDAGD